MLFDLITLPLQSKTSNNMKQTPIKREIIDGLIAKFGIQDFAKATIREVKQVAATAEKESGG